MIPGVTIKYTAASLVTALSTLFFVNPADASTDISVDGNTINMNEPILTENDRTLVPVRFVSEELGAEVDWNAEEREVEIETAQGDTIKLTIDNEMVELNGETYSMDVQAGINNERTYLPVRHVAELMHSNVHFANGHVHINEVSLHEVQPGENAENISTNYDVSTSDLMERNQMTDQSLSPGEMLKTVIPTVLAEDLVFEEETEEAVSEASTADIDALARLIHLEAQGEPVEGKIAVGNVVQNRVDNGNYPNTLEGVIRQSGQFTPVMTGAYDSATASATSIEAATRALEGENVVEGALYFHNPNVTSTAFFNNKPTIDVIGNHRFVR